MRESLIETNTVTSCVDPLSCQIIERQNKKFYTLYEIALSLCNFTDLKPILNYVLGIIIDFMKVDAGVIFVINDETLELIPTAFKNLSVEVIRDLTENKVKVGECMCGSIAQYDQEIIILKRASKDLRFTRESQKRAQMEFYAGFPLKAKGKVIGVLCVITFAPYKPEADHIDILRAATVPISLAIENARLFENVKKDAVTQLEYYNFDGIIGNSRRMKEVLKMVRKVTNVTSSILLSGESGTGKELIAKAIHYNSMRKHKPFIAVNCAAIPENLLESELFGYIKGAFTGASMDKKGLFEAADTGSIFLDEVEAMSKGLQAKLLRVLQDRTFFKVGGISPVNVDVRIIAATNKSLKEAVKSGHFREDLYYRLNVIKIMLPSLRERTEDITLLVRYFINKFNKKMGKNIRRVSKDAMDFLINYSWPGNVRELENTIERAVTVAETDEIGKGDLEAEIILGSGNHAVDWTLDTVEKEHILRILKITNGNKSKAASLLGINTTTLWRKLKCYQIEN